jgi:8-oxo-dGTP pyrophosphatase MutT (NUDIX family)
MVELDFKLGSKIPNGLATLYAVARIAVKALIDLPGGDGYAGAPFLTQSHFRPNSMSNFEVTGLRLRQRLDPLHDLQLEPARIPQAAVTIILREEIGDAQALIIKRAERPGDHWSGHLALPGGRVDPAKDPDLLATAARETYEEIGVNLLDAAGSRSRFIGQLPLLAPRNPILPPLEITPFVAIAPSQLALQLNHEVAEAFWVSVNQLKREGCSAEFRMQFGEVVKKWPAYPCAGGPIWGITERILTNFLTLLD